MVVEIKEVIKEYIKGFIKNLYDPPKKSGFTKTARMPRSVNGDEWRFWIRI